MNQKIEWVHATGYLLEHQIHAYFLVKDLVKCEGIAHIIAPDDLVIITNSN